MKIIGKVLFILLVAFTVLFIVLIVMVCVYMCTDHNFEYIDYEGNTHEAAFCNWQAGKAYCRLKDGRRVFDVKEYILKDSNENTQ